MGYTALSSRRKLLVPERLYVPVGYALGSSAAKGTSRHVSVFSINALYPDSGVFVSPGRVPATFVLRAEPNACISRWSAHILQGTLYEQFIDLHHSHPALATLDLDGGFFADAQWTVAASEYNVRIRLQHASQYLFLVRPGAEEYFIGEGWEDHLINAYNAPLDCGIPLPVELERNGQFVAFGVVILDRPEGGTHFVGRIRCVYGKDWNPDETHFTLCRHGCLIGTATAI